jgi:hypothetical protein
VNTLQAFRSFSSTSIFVLIAHMEHPNGYSGIRNERLPNLVVTSEKISVGITNPAVYGKLHDLDGKDSLENTNLRNI